MVIEIIDWPLLRWRGFLFRHYFWNEGKGYATRASQLGAEPAKDIDDALQRLAESIAKFLTATDTGSRRKAAVCLGTLRSPKVELVAPWMFRRDRADMEIGVWAVRCALPKARAVELMKAALGAQGDEQSHRALEEYIADGER